MTQGQGKHMQCVLTVNRGEFECFQTRKPVNPAGRVPGKPVFVPPVKAANLKGLPLLGNKGCWLGST